MGEKRIAIVSDLGVKRFLLPGWPPFDRVNAQPHLHEKNSPISLKNIPTISTYLEASSLPQHKDREIRKSFHFLFLYETFPHHSTCHFLTARFHPI